MNSKIKAGTWKTNITPPVGISTAGSVDEKHVQEIVDELYSSAVVIDDGKKEIAIVSVDVCAIPDEILNNIINGIEKNCGLDKNNIIIAATHTHTGPVLCNLFLGVGELWVDYIESFKKCVITSVVMAKKKMKDVKIGAGRGINEKFIFNRRLKKPDGSIIMNFTDKKFLQDCVETGTVDPEVTFLKFEDTEGRPVAFIVNYANHNNAMAAGSLISADWSGYMARILAKVYGEDVVTLFLPGACGDINWIDYKDFKQLYGPELVKKIGISLAGTVMENSYTMEYPKIYNIDVLHKKMYLEDRPFRDYDLVEDITFGTGHGVGKIVEQYRKERKFAEGKPLPVNEVDIHAITIGENIAIVTNPGELFAEYGLKIKEKSPFKYTLVSELTNGYAGYICTERAFAEGGYEVRKTNKSSHLEFKAGQKIVDASIKLLSKLFRK